MATLAPSHAAPIERDRFFPNMAIVMAALMIVAFSFHYLIGRSTFHAPLLTHIHAVAYMGWLGIFVVQSHLGVGQSRRMHRILGWTAALWAVTLIPLGFAIIIAMVRRGVTPFFFQPQHLMIADPLTVLAFAAFTFAAIRMRRRTDWHARLHISAMVMLMGPGFGRLLPMPMIDTYAFEVSFLAGFVFIVWGALRDRRRLGRVHPAWWFAVASIPVVLVGARGLAASSIGDALYRAATANSPGAAVDGRAPGNMPVS